MEGNGQIAEHGPRRRFGFSQARLNMSSPPLANHPTVIVCLAHHHHIASGTPIDCVSTTIMPSGMKGGANRELEHEQEQMTDGDCSDFVLLLPVVLARRCRGVGRRRRTL